MSKVLASITTSVDGYVTGPDDGPGRGAASGSTLGVRPPARLRGEALITTPPISNPADRALALPRPTGDQAAAAA